MSRVLSELLGAAEPGFSLKLKELEKISGNPSADIKLTSDIKAKLRAKAKELGLDPHDTGPREFYFALKDIAKLHDEHLAIAIGVMDGGAPSIGAIKKAVLKLKFNRGAWVLKHSVIKRLLAAHPPKNTMRMLGYRSIDSMLKRENLEKVVLGSKLAESSSWHLNFKKAMKKLGPTDFESRQIDVVSFAGDPFYELSQNFVRASGSNILSSVEAGAVGILPLPQKYSSGMTLAALAFLLEEMFKIRLASSYLKLHQVTAKFGDHVSRIDAGSILVAQLAGNPLHWHTVMRRYKHGQDVPQWLEPHLSIEDIAWQQAEEVLYSIEPSLSFWRGLDFCGTTDSGKPVSFNLLDNAVNLLNNFEYEQRHFGHMQNSLMHELFARYLAEEQIEQVVMAQIEQSIASASKPSILEMSFV